MKKIGENLWVYNGVSIERIWHSGYYVTVVPRFRADTLKGIKEMIRNEKS